MYRPKAAFIFKKLDYRSHSFNLKSLNSMNGLLFLKHLCFHLKISKKFLVYEFRFLAFQRLSKFMIHLFFNYQCLNLFFSQWYFFLYKIIYNFRNSCFDFDYFLFIAYLFGWFVGLTSSKIFPHLIKFSGCLSIFLIRWAASWS